MEMASSLRLTIQKLCKQVHLINFGCSPARNVRLRVWGSTVPNRAKYSSPKKNFRALRKSESLALEDNFDEECTVLDEAEDHLFEYGMGACLNSTDR